MVAFANPKAERAPWASRTSVATSVIRMYCHLKLAVVTALSRSLSKIHISFNRWTTKGGKRGYFGIVAHFTNDSGIIKDMPINLPQVLGSHDGKTIAGVVKLTLSSFGIHPLKLGYFVLDNALNNDTAVATLGSLYGFNSLYCRSLPYLQPCWQLAHVWQGPQLIR